MGNRSQRVRERTPAANQVTTSFPTCLLGCPDHPQWASSPFGHEVSKDLNSFTFCPENLTSDITFN